MKLKNLLSAGAAAVLCLAVLCSCGGGASSATPASSQPAAVSGAASASEVDVQAVADAILAVNTISNPFTLTDTNVKLDLNLEPEAYVAYACVRSNDTDTNAGTVFVIQAAEGQADAVVAALEAYRDAQVAVLSNYADTADIKVDMENASIQARGDLVVMAVVSTEAADAGAVQSAVDSALA